MTHPQITSSCPNCTELMLTDKIYCCMPPTGGAPSSTLRRLFVAATRRALFDRLTRNILTTMNNTPVLQSSVSELLNCCCKPAHAACRRRPIPRQLTATRRHMHACALRRFDTSKPLLRSHSSTMQRSMTRAVPVAAARLPRRPAHRASLVVRAAAEGLESWQVSKLKQAYAAGRRQVQVSRCREQCLWRLHSPRCLFSAT